MATSFFPSATTITTRTTTTSGLQKKSTHLSGDLLQDDGGCFKCTVPSRCSSFVLLCPPVLQGAGWHHIWRSVALAGSGPPLLLAAGLGCCLLVHCERTSSESCDDPDQRQASLHDWSCCRCCCSSAGSGRLNLR